MHHMLGFWFVFVLMLVVSRTGKLSWSAMIPVLYQSHHRCLQLSGTSVSSAELEEEAAFGISLD